MKRLAVPILFIMFTIAVLATGLAIGASNSIWIEKKVSYGDTPGEAPKSAESPQPWLMKDASGFFTLALVIVGSFQLGLFVWQLWLIRESLVDAKIAAEAAKETADAVKSGSGAAQDSANIARLSMIASDRAYIHYSGCRWTSHRQDKNSPIFWRIRAIWKNSGNTPPRNLRVYTQFELLDAPLPDDYQFIQQVHTEVPAVLPPKGEIFGSWRDFTGAEVAAVKEHKKFLYVWGIVQYRDVFPDTPPRITKFCNMAALVTGIPTLAWDEKTNPLDLGLMTFSWHNCADDDCDK